MSDHWDNITWDNQLFVFGLEQNIKLEGKEQPRNNC